MFGNFLAVICFVSLDLLFLVLTGILRLLPSMSRSLRLAVRSLLTVSTRFYQLILDRIAPAIFQHLGVNILSGLARITTTVLLSLVFGLIIFLLIHLPINGLTIFMSILHGFIVGLIWEGVSGSEDLNLGENIE